MENQHEESRAYWSERADKYSEHQMESSNSNKQQRFALIMNRYMPRLSRPIDALDVGCGSAFLSILLAQRGANATGTDFSDDMVEHAKENMKTFNLQGTFLQADAHDLPFEDESFDMVATRNMTWVIQDVKGAYAQMMRVLRPGGLLVNMDANHGREFNAADAAGITPTHATQSLEQLRKRNELARDLEITKVDRPSWDITTLWELGARHVECFRTVDEAVNAGNMIQPFDYAGSEAAGTHDDGVAPMFVLAAWK